MKKIFNTFLFLVIICLFVSPKFSFADALVTPLEGSLTSTSVTLRAENLEPNRSVILSVVNKNSASPHYSKQFQTTSSNIGKALIDFIGLSPNTEYIGSAYYEGENEPVGVTIPAFRTLAEKITKVTNITASSVTIEAENFPLNEDVTFTVENYSYQTQTYSETKQTTTDNNGRASVNFTGLSSGGRYKYYHSLEPERSGSFYAGGEPITPPGNGNNGGNNNGGGGGIVDRNLVPCWTTSNPTPCGFNDLIILVNKAINFVLIVSAVPIAAIMFAYAGFLMVFSGGAPESRTKAKGIFINVAIGLAFVAGAWIIVHTILSMLGYNQAIDWFGL